MTNVWIVTLPFFSHVTSAAQLAYQLARHGLIVTLFAATADLQRLQSNPVLKIWKGQGPDIKLQSLEITSPVLADSVGDKRRFLQPFLQTGPAFQKVLNKEFLRGFKPTCVISDFMVHGVHEAAAQYKIPSWSFCPFSVGYAATFVYVRQLESKGLLKLPPSQLDPEAQEELISLPGLPLLRICDLSSLYFKKSGHLHEYSLHLLQPFLNADVMLFSTFEEFEPRTVHAFRSLLKAHASQVSKQVPHVWTIGPTFPFLSYSEKARSKEDAEVDPSIKFLDSQPPSSVIYVAFGTDVNLTEEQIQELVYGLEGSHQPFLCVLHPPKRSSDSDVEVKDITSILPSDCLERIKSRSWFVRWAPQLEVLSHPSTGAFISHCGFSSVLESVSLGVPILAWPFQYDQFMNCRHLVDEAQISLQVCPALHIGGFVTRGDLEKSINTLFRSSEGTAVRERALQMKRRAEATTGENGSSSQNMKKVVALICNLSTTDAENLKL
ncbi:hypothetical protein R1flu_012386 [Riccia fluitans]|uniref:Glycosyltransferase n=1 Tax=Riccia fluitans TaxID=41844 RepID=A0ABD1ZBN0_9MARC